MSERNKRGGVNRASSLSAKKVRVNSVISDYNFNEV